MSLIGTAVAALVALMPPALLRKPKDEPEVEIARLKREIEDLERGLAAERNLSRHWMDEAYAIARNAREERDRRDLQIMRQYQPQQHHALQHQAQQAQAMQNVQYQQQQLANQQQLGSQAGVFDGFCNCVPSRHQMFDAMVEQLNLLRR